MGADRFDQTLHLVAVRVLLYDEGNENRSVTAASYLFRAV